MNAALTVSTYHPNLDGVSCYSASNCVAVGDSGVMVTTTNGGSSWTQVAVAKTGNYLGAVSCVLISSVPTCYVAGGAGTVLWSNNTGLTTWNAPSWTGSPATTDLLGVSCTVSGCTAVGESGTIFTFTLATSTFATKNSGTKQPFAAVSCTVPCWATGFPGMILSTTTTDTVVPAAVNFGTVDVNTGFMSTETITNTGPAPLVMGSITSGLGDYPISSDLCSGQSLAPAAHCTFVVTFTPTTTGTRAANITIPSNASSSPQTLAVTGFAALTDFFMVEGAGYAPYACRWLLDTQDSACNPNWVSMGGSILGAPQGCWNAYLKRLDVYAVGIDNKIWAGHFTESLIGVWTWSGWLVTVPGGTSSGTAGQTTATVACANDGTDHEEIFVKGYGVSTLYGAEYDPGNGAMIQTWQGVGGGGGLGAPGVTMSGSNVDIYVVGADNNVWRSSDPIGTFTGGWTYLGWTTSASTVGVDHRSFDGNDDVYVTLITSNYSYLTVWSGATNVGAQYLYGTLTGSAGGTWNTGELHIYGVGFGSGNNLWREVYASGWSGYLAPAYNAPAAGGSTGVVAD